MKATIYKAKDDEWIVIIYPNTEHEREIATCVSLEYAEALCQGMFWGFDVEQT